MRLTGAIGGLGVGLGMAATAHALEPDWPGFMARQDLVWTNGLAPDFFDGAFIGDGIQGAMVGRDNEDTNAVRMLLGHYNAITHASIPNWEYCESRVFAGSIIVAPNSTVQRQSMRLKLWDGEVTGSISTAEGSLQWSAFCERTHNVVIVVTSGKGGEAEVSPFVREEWGITPRWYLEPGRTTLGEIADYLPPRPERRRQGTVDLVLNRMRYRGAHVVASQRVREPDGRSVLFVAVGTDASADVNGAADTAARDAIGRVRAAVAEGAATLTARHRDWWHRYLQRSFMALPDDAYWEQFWWLQIYKFGSASSQDSALLIDTQGPWIWNSAWAAIWWNLNVQLSYGPMFSANQLDTGRSLINGVDRVYRSGAFHRNAGRSPGITVGRSTTQDGLGAWGDEFGNLPWMLHSYWRYWRYSGDDAVGRALFPMLRDSAAFLLDQLEEDTDGVLHLRPSRSPEYTEDLHPDANYGLMSVKWVLKTLLEMNSELGLENPQAHVWQDSLARLVPFPVDAHGLRVNANQGFDQSHRHFSHLLAVYPYHILTPEQGEAERELIVRSVDRWQGLKGGLAGYSYTGGCAMYATLGEGDRALGVLDQLKSLIQPNTLYREGGGPVIETPLSAVESINYLLLQSWGGVIRLFPAVPSRWRNIRFENLRGEGAFLVSAERTEGVIQHVSIRSEAGRTCTVVTPWEGRRLAVRDEGGQLVETHRAGNRVTFRTHAGARYTLSAEIP